MSKKTNVNLKKYFIAAMVTCFVMLIWSAYNSPLFPLYTSGDSSIFMLIGKGITEGKVPYRDLFDHKGPIFFWIEAAGWALGGRTGIWIIETLGTVFSVFMIMKICELFNSGFFIPVIGTAIVYLTLFGRGNLCENYSVPLVYLCVYLTIKYHQSEVIKHPWIYSFIYGTCFALLAFIRVNNATIICGFALCIIIRLIIAKEFDNLITNIIAGLVGIVFITLPICIYFLLNNALQDMLFCTFTYNFMYAAKHVELDDIGLLLKIAMYTPIAFSTLYFGFKSMLKSAEKSKHVFYLSTFFVSVLYFAELLYTNMAIHYHTAALPLYSVSLIVAFNEIRPKNLISALISKKAGIWFPLFLLISNIFLCTSLYHAAAPIYRHYLTDFCFSRFRDVQDCITVIPEEDRDSVIGYEIATSWYIDSGITPCYKYYSMQHWWSSDNYDVNQQFIDYVSSETPKWIITGKDISDNQLKKLLEDHYQQEAEGTWVYYKYTG